MRPRRCGWSADAMAVRLSNAQWNQHHTRQQTSTADADHINYTQYMYQLHKQANTVERCDQRRSFLRQLGNSTAEGLKFYGCVSVDIAAAADLALGNCFHRPVLDTLTNRADRG